jgi:hypothetical protein
MVGGDGLSFKKMVQLKHLQFHPDAFWSFRLIYPMIELWHLKWTNLSPIYKAHWGADSSSKDPGTLQNSATDISRKAPTKLSKVDYYPYLQLLYPVLDVCMLDCWQ